MGERRIINGFIYEKAADGSIVPVGPAQPSAIGPAIGNDPRIPVQLQGQALQNTKNAQDIANNPLLVANTKTNIEQGQNSINQSKIGNVQELRKEFNALPEVKNYGEVLTQMGKALRAPKGPQGDLAVIYAFAKAMDPGSVVREGEMDMANSTGSIISQLKVKYKSFRDGKGLPPEVRQGLVEEIRSAGRAMNESYSLRYRQYRDQAVELGANPKQVVGNHLGDAFRPLEQNYVRQHGGKADGSLASAPNLNMDGNAILQDGSPGSVQGSDTGLIGEKGGTHTQTFPGLEGANGIVNSMLKAHRPISEIATYLQGTGAPKEHIAGILQKAQAIQAWQAGEGKNYKGDFDVSIERQQVPNSLGQNLANSDIGTGSLLGANAALGGLPGVLAGAQPQIDIARGAHPRSSFAGELGGAIGGTLGLNKALSAIPSEYLAANPAKRLLAADLGYGATYGATQNPDNPGMGALVGGAAGLGGNLIGSKMAAPALRGIGGKLGFGTPALPAGEGMIAGQAIKANPDEVLGKLNEASDLGMPLTLADTDPRLRALGGSVVRKSPDAFALANENIGRRNLGQVDRLTGIVEGDLGQRLNLPTFQAGVEKTAQANSRPLYESAKAQGPIDDAQVNEMLRTPAGQKAARSGYDEAINNNEPVGDLTEEVDSITGQVRLVGRPSWNVLQRMKFALDGMPEQESLARRFNSRLGSLNPDFKKANLTYAKEMRRGDIAQSGYDLANPNVRAPELSSAMAAPKNMKDPALFRQGYGSNLIDKARGMRDAANPYEVAAMASPDQLLKMQAVSPGLRGKFDQARGIENEMSLTNKELFGGSPTQPRAEADKLFDAGGLASDALELGLAVGAGAPPINAMRTSLFGGRFGVRALQDAYQMGVGKSAKHKADAIAPMLFNPNPQDVSAQLAEMIRQQALRDAYVQRTGMFGSAVGAPLGISLTGR